MPLAELPVLVALKSKLKWHQARHGVLAENVANANSPGFQARDLKTPNFEQLVDRERTTSVVATARTDSRHIAGVSAGRGGAFTVEDTRQWESTPSGNNVSLESEMMKVTANQMDYQAAAGLYTRSLAMLRLALGQNGS